MRLKQFIPFLFVCISFSLFAQSYTPNREKFVKEFQKKISEFGKGEYTDFIKKELAVSLLETSDFSDEYFNRMIETCNLIESKRLKTYPEVYNYVYSVYSFVNQTRSNESYTAWHETVDQMLASRYVKKFKEFIEFSSGFFSEGRVSTSSNFAWFYFGGKADFKFDKKVSVLFDEGNLVCRAVSRSGKTRGDVLDSLQIIKAKGVYDPVLKKWTGSGGTITWEKVGVSPSETYAVLKGYQASFKSSSVQIDTVVLTTPYFDREIEGRLTERAFKVNRETDKIYPQFLSFERNLVIKDLVPNLDYVGGFALQGAKFFGAGTNKELAKITLRSNGKPILTASSEQIVVSDKKVSTEKARFSMYFKTGDSLFHPGVNLDYDLEKKQIILNRTRTGIGESPFQDSYHKLDIYVQQVKWNVDGENIYYTYDFSTGQEQRVAQFESQDYFNHRLYNSLQGLETNHPLVSLWKYAYKYDEYVLSEGSAATALGKTVDLSKSLLLKLSGLGFINYDTERKTVTINKKLENFVKANAGKRDYDNMVFLTDLRPKTLRGYTPEQIKNDDYLQAVEAQYEKLNAERRAKKEFGIMNLMSMDLDLEAVDNVLISDARNTVVFPKDGKVQIKENRDFIFKGWANFGKFEVETEQANFVYNDYKVKLQKTHKSLFRVRPMDKTHGTKGIPMASSIVGVTGEVLIDSPENRSGRKEGTENYPILKSVTSTKVFYNSKEIYRGAYDSTRFYYAISPFELDSLNNFKEEKLRFKGELVSAGIFPKIDQDLKIMPDYSFGFSTVAPTGGYKFYNTDAKYENKIVLSNNGLQGEGTINFVESTSISKALSFLPDSTVGVADFVNRPVEKGVEFPDVSSKRAFITYIPKQNVLRASSTPKNELVFFDEEASLRGTITIRPKGMNGKGLMTFKNANLISDDFEYTRYNVLADTSSFRLKNESTDVSEDALAFKTDNVKCKVSFEERIGQFNSNEGESTVEFPVNQFMAKMDQFKWFMDELSLEMEKKDEQEINIESGVDLVGSNFFSLNKKQDSLNFRAPRAKFDIMSKSIFCEKVEYLDIADARIYPDSMKLTIRKKAKIDKLKNSSIIANYITKYHKFEQAEVEIKGRRAYKASGEYPYYDLDSNVTYITMKDIHLDTSYQTVASGKVDVEKDFKLSEQFDFYGDVSIMAANPLIDFKGATRINHNCEKFDRNWMAFESEIDPKNIQIPVLKEMKDLNGGAIAAGIVWRDSKSTDSLKMYPTFLSALEDSEDPIVITASGLLQYDPGTKEFQIASKDKLINRGEVGNYIALHTESCSMNGDGVIDLGMNYGDVVIDAVGVVNYNQSTGETSMNVTAKFNMPVDKGLMQDVAERMNEIEALKPISFNSTTLDQAITEWDGMKAADKFKEEFVQEGSVKKVPNGLESAITITGLRLSSFDDPQLQERGLITNVDAAGLVSLYGKPVMKYVPLKGFFQKTYSGARSDGFTMHINLPAGRDYLFHYSMQKKDGLLRIKTGDVEFSEGVNAIKEEKRKKKNFNYEITTNSVFLAKFMRLFE